MCCIFVCLVVILLLLHTVRRHFNTRLIEVKSARFLVYIKYNIFYAEISINFSLHAISCVKFSVFCLCITLLCSIKFIYVYMLLRFVDPSV